MMVSDQVACRDDGLCARRIGLLRQVLGLHGGVWFGPSGRAAETARVARRHDARGGFERMEMDLPPSDHRALHSGFNAHVLHALVQSRLHDMAFDRDELVAWLGVNARMAAALAPLLRPDDRIWVNDFQLLPLAAGLRALGVRNRIGVFLHDAVPACNVLASLPCHDDALRGLLACDLVGVQTPRDQRALREYLVAFHAATAAGPQALNVGARVVRLIVQPAGIDVEHVAELARRAQERALFQRFVARLGGHKLLIGVDRPSASNGLCQRLHAIDELLQRWPELAGSFSLLQIAPPVRQGLPGYAALDARISRHVSDVNGRHGGPEWTPVRYLKRGFRESVLTGYMRIADVGLMTPVGEGMTLAAKEYLACQDPSDPGVLVLSRFSGAAGQLTDALRVNPLDAGDMAAGIRTAMRMPLDERQARWAASMCVLRQHDLRRWSRSFLRALAPARARAGVVALTSSRRE